MRNIDPLLQAKLDSGATTWLLSTLAATPSGTATEYEIVEHDFDITPGSTLTTPLLIPANAQVVGVTGRVTQTIGGSLSAWSLGVENTSDTAPNRYSTGLGKGLNSYVLGITSAPVTYYEETSLLLSATGGDFATGQVRFAVHFMTLSPPRAV